VCLLRHTGTCNNPPLCKHCFRCFNSLAHEQSLHIYARMNESAYTYWLTKAMRADVSSVRATTLQRDLPLLDDVEIVRGLLALNLADRTD
jgi:hypothetical protein